MNPMMNKNRQLASVIVGSLKPKYEDLKKENETVASEGDDVKDDIDPGLLAAADEIISAIESKDSRALAEALKAFDDICEQLEDEETEPGEGLPESI